VKQSRFVVVAVLAACGGGGVTGDPTQDGGPPDGEPGPDSAPGPDAIPPFPFVHCETPDAPAPPLIENREVYAQDALDVLVVDVDTTDLVGLQAVNDGVGGAEVMVSFSQGEEFLAHGRMRIRGGASRVNAQKNYKIELDDGARWLGQKEINLNKHMWDLTRMRNKLAFDLFQTVPHFTSLRTRYVQMFVNGEDYGLYTWIEEPDKRFLESHGLDPDGQLYKPTVFYFKEIDPAIAEVPELMELIIDPKANEDNDKLLRMLVALHDNATPIGEIVDRYFQRDNLVTWLAVNILLNNIDTLTQNFYLYSPSSCEGWYILPWDYDGAWGFYGQLTEDYRERWQSGLTNWWPSHLFRRVFRDPQLVQAIDDKVHELSQTVLTDNAAAARMAAYHDLVEPFITTQPDVAHIPGHWVGAGPDHAIELWEGEQQRISSTVLRFREEYETVIERPMPVRTGTDYEEDGSIELSWDPSFDLQGDPITYDVTVTTLDGTPVWQVDDQPTIDHVLVPGQLPPGEYHWRLVIEDHQTPSSWQLPYVIAEPLTIP
jgi:hypothetical protein